MEPKIGMRFGSFNEVLRTAQKNKEVKNMSVYTIENGRTRTQIELKKGLLYIEEPAQYSQDLNTNIEYRSSSFLYRGKGMNGKYTNFTEIHGEKTYAKDLNGNGIVDKGEIFKHK